MRTTRFFVIFFFLATLFLPIIGFSLGVYFTLYGNLHRPYRLTPSSRGLPAPLETRVPSFDGVELSTWSFPAPVSAPAAPPAELSRYFHGSIPFSASHGNATVFVVHGHSSNMAHFKDEEEQSPLDKAVRAFHLAGFRVIALDLRGHGRSGDGKPTTFGLDESRDILAVIEHFRGSVSPRIGVWGASMGAASTLLALERARGGGAIKCAVVDSPYASFRRVIEFRLPGQWGLPWPIAPLYLRFMELLAPFDIDEIDIERAIAATDVPLFLTHGTRDPVVDFRDAERLREAAERHGVDLTFCPHQYTHVRAYQDRKCFLDMIDFMHKHL